MEFKDYYKILGVADSADADEIKKSYRKLARKYHPDVSKEANAEDKFKELGEAYEVLKDPEKRSEYDELKNAGAYNPDGKFHPPPGWESAAHFSSGGFTDADASHFSDFFEAVFGKGGSAHRTYNQQGGQRSFRMRGDDLHHKLALFLEEVYQGAEKQIRLSIPEVDDYGLVSHKQKTLNVKIPPGITQGQHIRLKGQGAPGVGGGESGDLFLEIELAPHPLYRAVGKDLFLELPISPWEAALGTEVTAPTLTGKVRVKIPAASRAGQKLRLKAMGLPGKNTGDLIISLKIEMPAHHSAEAKALYEQLAKLEGFNPRAALGV